VSPTTAPALSEQQLTFTYTASSCGLTSASVVLVSIPTGWTPPSSATTGPGSLVSHTGPVSTSVDGGLIEITPTAPTTPTQVSVVDLAPTDTFTVTYDGIAPAAAEVSTFTTSEGPSDDGVPAELTNSPTVTVTPTAPLLRAHGAVTVSPDALLVGGSGPLTFTYTAGRDGLPTSGSVVIVVPRPWVAPSLTRGDPGFVRIVGATSGQVAVETRQIVVSGVSLQKGRTVSVRYGGRARIAPDSAGVSLFRVADRADSAAPPVALAPQAVAVVAPAGHARSSTWRDVVLVVILVVAAGAVAATARRLHRHRTPSGKPEVRPVPGAPGNVTVKVAATSLSLTVRVVPHHGITTTTMKRGQDDLT
jgi:hypothetical protein